jgi:hypothetical protein
MRTNASMSAKTEQFLKEHPRVTLENKTDDYDQQTLVECGEDKQHMGARSWCTSTQGAQHACC